MTAKTNKKKNTITAYFLCGLAIMLWGSVATVAKGKLGNVPLIELIFYLSFFAATTLFFSLLFQHKLRLFRAYSALDFLKMATAGLLGIFLYNYLYLKAISFTSATEVSILTYTWPILLVVLSSFLLKEGWSRMKIFSLVIGFAGVLVTLSGAQFRTVSFGTGSLLVLFSALVYALFFTLSKKYAYETYMFTFVSYLASFLFALVLVMSTKTLTNLPDDAMFAILYLGVLPSAIGHSFVVEALKLGDTSKIANLLYLTPVVSLLFISVFLGEPIGFAKAMGLVLILLAIMLDQIVGKVKLYLPQKAYS